MDSQASNAVSELIEALRGIDLLLQAGQLDAAEARCRHLLQRFADAGEAWLRLGFVLLARNDAVAAGDALSRGIELQPGNSALWVQLGIALERQGLGVEAEDAAR